MTQLNRLTATLVLNILAIKHEIIYNNKLHETRYYIGQHVLTNKIAEVQTVDEYCCISINSVEGDHPHFQQYGFKSPNLKGNMHKECKMNPWIELSPSPTKQTIETKAKAKKKQNNL